MRNRIQILIIAILFSTQLFGQEYQLIFNSEYSNKNVQSLQNFRGDTATINSKLRFLLNELHLEGYLAASIDTIQFESDIVYVDLYLGKKYQWSKLGLLYVEEEINDNLNLKRNTFKSASIEELQEVKNKILSYYENNGYPFAKVYLSEFEIDDSLFSAEIKVEKGDFYTLDSLIVKGDAKISLNYLKKTLQIEKGIPFNQNRINSISKNISDLRFLSEIKPAEIEFRDNGADLYLYLENKKANMFNGIIGFLPENEKTGKLLITGELNLGLVNSFGKGEEIFLNWEKMESSTQKLDIGFSYPYLFATSLGLDSDFGLYKKDSSYLSLNAEIGLRLFLAYDEYIKAYYSYKNSSRIGEENTSLLLNIADVKSNIYGARYYLNDLNYRYNPRKGFKLELFAGVGSKKIQALDNILDSLNLNTDHNIEVEAGLDLDVYYPIYKNFVFHFGSTTRYLEKFSESNKEIVFFENELYRFGGAGSLRGFDESIFYASIYSIQDVEIKYLFEQNSAFYMFWNGAYYYKNVLQEVTEDFPWGFGIGLDFDTRAGIFSLSYALGKQFDNSFELQNAKIHFGYVSRF